MDRTMILALAAVAAIFITVAAPRAEAQISIQFGVAPSCPYGYNGPEWFHGRAFIGAGPWFHERNEFHGHGDGDRHPSGDKH
jgi:hypothetical protein